MTNKVYPTAADAVADIPSGASIAVGGFGLCGIPDALIEALPELGSGELEVISNNCGVDEHGLGILLESRQVRRVTASYVGENKEFARQYLNGELEVELTPQGTLAGTIARRRCRDTRLLHPRWRRHVRSVDGGLPWRYTLRRFDIAVASPPKETREFNGQAVRSRARR